MPDDALIPKHGGYRRLKSFQVAQLAYDLTVLFCDRYIDRRSRTHDQMVQAARSGVQNIAEGSQASGTSKKMELKLTNVARASLEELRLDYEDYLRQRGLAAWPPGHPALQRFKARRCATMEDIHAWYLEERRLAAGQGTHQRTEQGQGNETRTDTDQGTRTSTDGHGPETGGGGSGAVSVGPCQSVSVGVGPISPGSHSPQELVANAALSLLNVCCYFLDRQLAAQSDAFIQEGGFTERLYRARRGNRG